MSSLMIVQEHNRITFAVDTARCMGSNNGTLYRYYNEKVQKIHKAGSDMVFIAGMTECTEQVEKNISSFVDDQHINAELLKQYLRKEFPKEKSKYLDTGLNDIGITILSVINGESRVLNFGQDNNFEPVISKAHHGVTKLFVDGFDNARIYKYALTYISKNKRVACNDIKNFINVYQHCYSEGVGGYIRIYSMGSGGCKLIKEHKLNEEGLKYVYSQNDLNTLGIQHFSSLVTASSFIGGTIEGTDITGVNITGTTITGSTITGTTINGGTITGTTIEGVSISGSNFTSTGTGGTTTIANGSIDSEFIQLGDRAAGDEYMTQIQTNQIMVIGPHGNSLIDSHYVACSAVICDTVNGYAPITTNNIGSQSVSYASSAGSTSYASSAGSASSLGGSVYISSYGNFRPVSDAGAACGTSEGRWSSVWAVNGTIQTSDERQKTNIVELDADPRWLAFAKMITPYSFQMINGTSGRQHTGFIAQRIEEAMTACGITDMEFAGLIKSPVYAKRLIDKDGIELPEYDTTSEITGYDYGLRYEEFIPLLFLLFQNM